MTTLIQDIKPRASDSAYVVASFDMGKAKLESKGYRVISLEENAKLRIQEGKDAGISKNGNWTREGVLYLPDQRILLTKNSPVMDVPKDATKCHIDGTEFYLTDQQVRRALEDSFEIKDREVPTNRFGEDGLTVYAFGEVAKQYGEFLRDAKIGSMLIWLADIQDKPFVRQMWFRSLVDWSVLDGYCRNLGCDSRVRGVK